MIYNSERMLNAKKLLDFVMISKEGFETLKIKKNINCLGQAIEAHIKDQINQYRVS